MDPTIDGFAEASKLTSLAQIADIRAQVNDRFAKGNTTTSGITTATGLVSIPLEAPAKSLYNVFLKLRQRIARESEGKGGLSITWRALTSIYAGGVDAGIAEGAVGSTVQFTEADVSATYRTLGRLASATYEAISAAQTFDDAVSKATLGGLQNLQVSEENSLIGGCTTGIAAPGTVSGAGATTSGGGLTSGTTYYWGVSAVTLMGTAGGGRVAANGNDSTRGAGWAAAYPWLTTANDSPNETTVHTGSGSPGGSFNSIKLSWASVKGAFAYNVYVGTTSTLYYLTQVTVPAFTMVAVPTNTGNVVNTSNETANPYQFDGVATQAALATGANWTDLAGAALTADTGGVAQFNAALETMATGPIVAPSLMLLSPHDANTVRTLILSAGTAVSTQRFNAEVGPQGEIRGGTIFMEYTNPFFPGMPMEVLAHPFVPQGTALLITEKLPPWYPNANISTTWAIDTRREFYSIEYAIATASGRVKPIGVYVEEVLKGYFPTGTAVLTGIGA